MKIDIRCRTQLNNDELIISEELSSKLNISHEVSVMLVAKGIKTVAEANDFLFATKNKFYNPYLLSGMEEVVIRLKNAINDKEKIIVYGDYDADGLCSTYILHKGLEELGANVSYYIPDRSEGYGLNIKSVDKILETEMPDIILTCDLGISCVKEIEHIKDLGVDVLVSDHHELPEILPHCPSINPKKDIGKYPFIELCGAGVALKIIQAMNPDNYMKYIEYACLATIADSVPLIDENRIIVKLGLEKLNNNPSKQLKLFMKVSGIKGRITSETIAYVLAPRINASGRMGDATRSLRLFFCDNDDEIIKIANDINLDNIKRQELTKNIYEESCKMHLADSGKRAILLANSNWHGGLLGIVASNLTAEFTKPTILFFDNGDTLRGSGRSIPNLNLYEMLSSMRELFVTFGGHCQACGLTIKKSKFNEFRYRVERYLKEKVKIEDFLPNFEYDFDENASNPSKELIKDLSSLEPYGVGNIKPIFKKEVGSMLMSPMKNYPNHLIGDGDFKNLLAFSQGNYLELFMSNIKKAVFIDYSINLYRGKESVRGNIKDLLSVSNIKKIEQKEDLQEYLFKRNSEKIMPISFKGLEKLLDNDDFGVLVVVNTYEGYQELKKKFDNRPYLIETGLIVAKTNVNRLVFNAKSSINFEKFHTIVFYEDAASVDLTNLREKSKIYSLNNTEYVKQVSLKANRNEFIKFYKILNKLDGNFVITANNIIRPLNISPKDSLKLIYAYAVFKELGIINIINNKLKINKNRKTALEKSKLFILLDYGKK